MENSAVDIIDIINYVCYNESIIINRKDNMKLKDEIARIEKQSKQIADIRKDIEDIMEKL